MCATWLQISSGQGPLECQWAVAGVLQTMEAEMADAGVRFEVLERVPGLKSGTYRSALVALSGTGVADQISSWVGTVQWIGRLKGGSRNGRKNWYVGVTTIAPPEKVQWSVDEVRTDVMRASGPGGQHVNKTSSAVRVTHVPTGLSAIAREERSQHRNRALAMAQLAELFNARHSNNKQKSRGKQHKQHGHLTRGNPVRVYIGEDFVRVPENESQG